MSSATYAQPAGDVILDVIKDHKDGTVDLGIDGRVIVSKCPVVDKTKAGYGSCVLNVEEPEVKEGDKNAAKGNDKNAK